MSLGLLRFCETKPMALAILVPAWTPRKSDVAYIELVLAATDAARQTSGAVGIATGRHIINPPIRQLRPTKPMKPAKWTYFSMSSGGMSSAGMAAHRKIAAWVTPRRRARVS